MTSSRARRLGGGSTMAGAVVLWMFLGLTVGFGGIDLQMELAAMIALMITPYAANVDLAIRWFYEDAAEVESPATLRRNAKLAYGAALSAIGYAALGASFLLLKGRGELTLAALHAIFGAATGGMLLALNVSLRGLFPPKSE